MLPQIDDGLGDNFEVGMQPLKTWKLNRNSFHLEKEVDAEESIKQAIYCILNTERYDCIIHSWDYGVELKELIGEPISYVLPELKRRITEALTQDERILSVDNFTFDTRKKGVIAVSFVANTDCGGITQGIEVNV